MADDEIANDLDRLLRTALTVGGQLIERYSRTRADGQRDRLRDATEARHLIDRERMHRIEAGRAVYGAVRDPETWSRPDAQRNLGEALVAAEALRDVDPRAAVEARYMRAEARRRFGHEGEAWLAAGVATFLDEEREISDRRASRDDDARGAEDLGEAPAPPAAGRDAVPGTGDDRDPVRVDREPLDQDRPAAGQEAGEAHSERRAAQPGFPRPALEDHALRAPGATRKASPAVARAHGRDLQGRG